MFIDAEEAYKKIKHGIEKYKEEKHCPLILSIMSHPFKGTHSAFCAEVGIGETKFYEWLKAHEIFKECYALGKMLCKENWEAEGRDIARESNMPGETNHRFEHWRMMGWARFGIGKNSRIRLALSPSGTPNEHYSQLIYQASQGDFTAGEIKQLMEAINVGLNTHQVFKLQQELDDIKADLVTMTENANVHDTLADQRITKAD